MSKTRRNFFDDEDRFEYDTGDYKRYENNRTKRKNKRMNRAIKSKDIDSLMELEDEDYD